MCFCETYSWVIWLEGLVYAESQNKLVFQRRCTVSLCRFILNIYCASLLCTFIWGDVFSRQVLVRVKKTRVKASKADHEYYTDLYKCSGIICQCNFFIALWVYLTKKKVFMKQPFLHVLLCYFLLAKYLLASISGQNVALHSKMIHFLAHFLNVSHRCSRYPYQVWAGSINKQAGLSKLFLVYVEYAIQCLKFLSL